MQSKRPGKSAGKSRITPGRREEELRRASAADLSKVSDKDAKRLFLELQVHKDALERENQELREAQLQLLSARDRYLDLYDYSSFGYLSIDRNGVIRDGNPIAAALFGVEPAFFPGLKFSDFVMPGFKKLSSAYWNRVLHTADQHICDLTLERLDGVPVSARFYGVRYQCTPGADWQCRAAFVEIEEPGGGEHHLNLRERRHTLEQRAALQLEEIDLLASAIANLGEGVMISLGHRNWLDSRIVFVNEALCHMLGYSGKELRGISPGSLSPTTFDTHITRYLEGQLAANQKFLRELIFQRKDGTEQEVELLISPFSSSDQAFGNYISIIRNVSERNSSQKQLQELRRDVLRSVDDVQLRIGRALHDGPQQALSGLAFMSRGLTLDLKHAGSPLEVKSDRISTGLMEINKSIRSLAAGLVPFPLDNGGLRTGLKYLAAKANEEYGFECELLCAGAITLTDKYAMNQLYYIAQEAVFNAFRHSGGKRIVIELEQSEQQLTLRVTDDGFGFSTAEPLASGEGLGMYIMPYRAATIGGALAVCGGENGGTVVACTVPLPCG